MTELPAERLLRQLRGIQFPPKVSKYRGVSWNPMKGTWSVNVMYRGKTITRHFRNDEDAARVYDVMMSIIYEGVPEIEIPPNAGIRKGFNFDGRPPKGLLRAEIRGWLIDAGLIENPV